MGFVNSGHSQKLEITVNIEQWLLKIAYYVKYTQYDLPNIFVHNFS